MGVIEVALRTEGRFSRLYALKRPHFALRHDVELRAMFVDEGRLAGLVRHANVVSVHEVGEDAAGPYLVMDFVEGISAASLIAREAARDGRLPLPLCLSIAAQAARGLHAAHEVRGGDGRPLGLVHRDVSPQNLIVGYDGVTRVTDFGIAKAYGNVSRTSTGLLKGNVGYMAPEQLRFHEPDRRSDLFSLGVVLYELMAGRRLYREDDVGAAARRILEEPPPDVGELRNDVPPELTGLMFELLAKDPDSRPADAQDVARRLEAILRAYEAEAGPFDVGAYVAKEFEAERAEQSRALAEAEARVLLAPRRARRTWGVGVGLLAVVLAAAAAVRGGRVPPPAPGSTMGPAAAGGGPWAGAWHTCAPRANGLDCWGKNNEGQLGDGQTMNRVVRRPVRELQGVVHAAGGAFHTCAVVAGGDLHCWGRNADGQLGLPEANVPLPRKVPAFVGARAVVADESYTCVLLASGRVACLGALHPDDDGPPTRLSGEIAGIEDAVQVASRAGTVCARRADGRVLCFGRNDRGALGTGARAPLVMSPAPVLGLEDAVDVGVGRQFACAVRATGQVLCWGDNTAEQLGVPETDVPRPWPGPVPGLEGIVHLATLGASTCALARTGRVLCWGRGDWGTLGDGTLGSGLVRHTPREVPQLEGVTFLSAGAVHVCARRAAGDVLCWGDNANGQLGDGTLDRRSRPVSVPAAP